MAGSRVRDCVNAAVDALKVDAALITLLGTAKVGTHLPQGTDTPYALVMGGDEIPWGPTFVRTGIGSPDGTDGGDNGSRQVDVLVRCTSTYRGSSQVDQIASRVMELLTEDGTWSLVERFELVEFVRNAMQPPIDLNTDGLMWFERFVTVRVSLV